MKVGQRHYRALLWAVQSAEAWRGSLTGNPDQLPLRIFDLQCKFAREALAELRKGPKRERK